MVARGAGIGKIFYRYENFNAIGRLLILKSEVLFNLYCYYYFINDFKINTEETGVPQLTKPKILNILIKFPSFSEQQKIAKFFSLLDKQIELWETKLKLNEQF
ncbi:MAG: restriction endonuclease subunit S, partial [Clostridia bacterium]